MASKSLPDAPGSEHAAEVQKANVNNVKTG